MNNEIKPIETVYKGYRFRSRLEARWAVFFDAAGIEYEYEIEGFEKENGMRYLPDFYLPDEDMYVEVKPPRKGALQEIRNAISFVGKQIDTLLILSNIPNNTSLIWCYPVICWNAIERNLYTKYCPFLPAYDDDECLYGLYLEREFTEPSYTSHYVAAMIRNVKDINQEKNLNELLNAKKYIVDDYDYDDALSEGQIKFIREIWDKPRQARFEHGECG